MIEFHRGLFNHPEGCASLLSPFGPRCAIVISEEIFSLYGQKIMRALPEALLLLFPGGEASKTRATKERLEDQLLSHRWGRDMTLIAIGGGVTTDLGGFLAATYCRGIPLILVPTSLLAMVDAAVGGKTGVNTPQGKNLIGAFYPAHKIVIDIDFLLTLPPKEYRNGIVEMVKHGAIADVQHFNDLEPHPLMTESLIRNSIEIKQRIVAGDERETGKRALLNFGHTIGHALETLSNYTLSHGEAVALGMAIESEISCRLGHLSIASKQRIQHVLRSYGLPLSLPSMDSSAILDVMQVDKKSVLGVPRLILLEEIGKPLGPLSVDPELLRDTINMFIDNQSVIMA